MKKDQFKWASAGLALSSLLVVSACGNDSSNNASAEEATTWLEQANLEANESPEELYELAKEEGKVVVYSQSSRIKDVKASFEKEYPGIQVDAFDLGTIEIVEKVAREQEAGLNTADVVFVKDGGGVVSGELLSEGMLHKYAPDDLVASLDDSFLDEPGLPFYFSTRAIFVNNEVYDDSTITNWWDLTDEEWKSKIVMDDPLLSSDTLDLFTTIVQNADDMEEAYKQKFGEEIELDGTDNAGYEFIKQLLANDPVFVSSGDDVVEAVGTPGQEKPPVGITTSSKSRHIEEQGYMAEFLYDVEPKMSVAGTSYLYMANNAEHTAAAKLLIRWMAGEADGQGEGFRPYNVPGSWSTRTDVSVDGQRSSDELTLWPYDGEFLYDNSNDVRNFILGNQ
ncbi:ABC transporter substrate-binding protein [Alkalicoccobacillus murimartini]|uniref:Iron(III) transport system substrate-binding protein n=1 Tax=Alkalicoccobacillus murimartini TaxID=171685 RepID=A0ABT9YIS5_9BACI|nr:extracellular solute-binding protein [Alkalicoccobacillus murimartini]MDQ0207390.1 iron(III) transport system substrate-binding protein [Alkalicoccobacillus murimartini]